MNRRTFLTGAAGAAMASLPAARAMPPSDPVSALVAEYFRLFAIDHDTDEKIEAHCEVIAAVEEQVCATPAVTAVGLRDKMRVLVHQLAGNTVAHDEPIVASILSDLERLAG